MSLVQIEQLTKSFGADVLFAPFSAQIAPGDRIALIGDNGVGKSTLLRLLASDETPTAGAVRPIGSVRVGYLPQAARLAGEGTLLDAMRTAFASLREAEQELRALEQRLAQNPSEDDVHRYDDLLHRFEAEGGYEIEATIRAALAGVGFADADSDKPVEFLSGGEEARAALARVLVENPDLLLLDEPTNHLDFGALDWLEERLAEFAGALVLVSHDRHLLERVANRTWEIAFGEVTTYRVGYSASRELRDEERRKRLEAFESQEETIEKYKDFIRRHKVGQKHRQAKDREKKLERLEEARIDRPREAKRIHLRISAGAPSGKRVLALRDLAVGFDQPLITFPDIDLYRDEKVAIIGPNGCGKTSLLRTILGELAPLSGGVELGHGVKTALFSQTQEGLHDERSVLDTVLGRTNLTISEARGLLGAFLFSGDEVDKKTKNLSGGERSRVALALLSLMEGNLLLLDEPTNHLDLASQEILEAALLAYEGTVLLVSHDRALLEAVTDRVWLVEGTRVRAMSYGYAEYHRRLAESRREGDACRPNSKHSAPEARPGQARPKAEQQKPERPRKVDRYQSERLEGERRALEQEIESLEAALAAAEQGLAEASAKGETQRIATLGKEYARAKAELEAKIEQWGALPASVE